MGVSAGAWGGLAFKAYVDDITVCAALSPEPRALNTRLKTMLRRLTEGFKGEGYCAVTGFSTKGGASSGLTALLDDYGSSAERVDGKPARLPGQEHKDSV